jgi:ATP-dependent HslUV protease ATP-binding subunit HslU
MRASLTPKQIVAELDRYIVGQHAAKKAVAVALRNRWRRQQVPAELRDDITPKNIILIGPTGVGKTEIARRLAKLANAPFVKVEASKFTEVGYVGRDVESMVRDLVESSIALVRDEASARVKEKAVSLAEVRLAETLRQVAGSGFGPKPTALSPADLELFRAQLRAGTLDDESLEIEVADSPMAFVKTFPGQGLDEMGINLGELFKNMPGASRSKKRRVSVREALAVFEQEEAQKLVDQDTVTRDAVKRAENDGIIFLDEIDKIASREGRTAGGPDVSREGVQRDLLPIVEGSTVNTKYGPVRTDHVLFIAAGAFHVSKPSDLIPELQGRFPIRVELEALKSEDLVRILKEPKNSLIRQYAALLSADGIELVFEETAIDEIASMAQRVNERDQNIGARRLHTILERILSDISFEATEANSTRYVVDVALVQRSIAVLVKDEDLSRYIL